MWAESSKLYILFLVTVTSSEVNVITVKSKLEVFFHLFLIHCLNFMPLNNGTGSVHKTILSLYIPPQNECSAWELF